MLTDDLNTWSISAYHSNKCCLRPVLFHVVQETPSGYKFSLLSYQVGNVSWHVTKLVRKLVFNNLRPNYDHEIPGTKSPIIIDCCKFVLEKLGATHRVRRAQRNKFLTSEHRNINHKPFSLWKRRFFNPNHNWALLHFTWNGALPQNHNEQLGWS